MAEIIKVLSAVLPVFLITFLGYQFRRINWLTRDADESLMRVAMNVLLPCLAFSKISGNEAIPLHLCVDHDGVQKATADAKIKAVAADDPALVEADLSDSGIGDVRARALAAALARNTHLRALKLKGNDDLGEEGARAIGEALYANGALVATADKVGAVRRGEEGALATS